jgi:ABC-type transporter Mla MlaB component
MHINSEKFTIYEVEEIYKEFSSTLKSGEAVDVNLDGVVKIDMPAIQLLVSVLKTCEADSIPFSLSNVSNEVKESLKMAGCNTLFGVDDE